MALSACLVVFTLTQIARAGTLVQFNFNAPTGVDNSGSVMVDLFDDLTPATVANFLKYVNAGEYQSTVIHRSIPGFIIQGGGYGLPSSLTDTSAFPHIATTFTSPINEFSRSNTRGTIAMAKLGTDPNSATSEWFFNLADNSANLDHQNGGFTAFGWVVGPGMTNVVDKIAADPTYYYKNFNDQTQAPSFPVQNLAQGSIAQSNLVILNSISVVITHPSFQNPVLAADVNNDGAVHPNDVNTIITDLLDHNNQPHPVVGPFSGVSYLDVNGDGLISAKDVNVVITALLDQTPALQPATSLMMATGMSIVPEPSSCLLAATGALALFAYIVRRRRQPLKPGLISQ